MSGLPGVNPTTSSLVIGWFAVTETSLNPLLPEVASASSTSTSTGKSWWFGGQRMLGRAAHLNVGAVLSSLTVTVCGASTLPELSTAAKVTVVVPSVLIGTETVSPDTVVEGTACAPVAEYVMLATPEPPASSPACSTPVRSEVSQPAAFGA